MERLARWCYAHRWRVLILWIVALVGIGVLGSVAGGSYSNNFSLPGVTDVRVLGAIGVVQLDRPVDVAAATAAATAHGVWLRPFRDLVYTMPPYVIDSDDLEVVCGGVCAAVEAALQTAV